MALSNMSVELAARSSELSPSSVLRPAIGEAASSAEKEGTRNGVNDDPPGLANDGLTILGLPPEDDFLAREGLEILDLGLESDRLSNESDARG